MTFESTKLLDDVGWRLLSLLQENARRGYSELGREVGLSPPAVAERMRRMEEAGIITGYHASVDYQRIGLPVTALLRLSGIAETAPQVSAALAAMPSIIECHRVTGDDSYVIIVVAESIGQLEQLIDQLLPYGHVTTSLVLSSPVTRRSIRR